MARIRPGSINLPNLSKLPIDIYLEGDWDGLNKYMDELSDRIQEAYDRTINKVSSDILKIVKRCIRTGTPPPGTKWDPLSPSTISTYGPHPIYNLTGLYYRNIGLYRHKNRTYVGVKMNARNFRGDLTLSQLARILEMGANGETIIPPRPLWIPALNAIGGLPSIQKKLIRAIAKNLRP